VSGIAATNLIVLLPVLPGRGETLRAALEALPEGEASMFARAGGTHFGRWTFVPALTGPGNTPLPEGGSYLLMCADFDASVAEWTSALCRSARPELDAVLSHCAGYPGTEDPAAWTSYLVAHAAPRGFTVAGYRATVTEVREALRLRSALRSLVVRGAREKLSPAALREAWWEAAVG
jgi:hypothetical protein